QRRHRHRPFLLAPRDVHGDRVHVPPGRLAGHLEIGRRHRRDHAFPREVALRPALAPLLGQGDLAHLLIGQQGRLLVIARELEQAQALGEALHGDHDGEAQDRERHQDLEQGEAARARHWRLLRTRPVSASTVTRYVMAPEASRKSPPLEPPCGSKRTVSAGGGVASTVSRSGRARVSRTSPSGPPARTLMRWAAASTTTAWGFWLTMARSRACRSSA